MYVVIKCSFLLVIAHLISVVVFSSYSAAANEHKNITVLGNTLPPFGYVSSGNLSGFSLDLVKLLLKMNNLEDEHITAQHVPFARAFAQLQKKNNTIALHFARSKEREDKFHWVGPYYEISMGLLGLKSNRISFDEFEKIKSKKVAVVRDTLLTDILLKKGFPKDNLVEISKPDIGLKMLLAKRVDLFAHIPSVSYYIFEKELEMDSRLIEEKYSLQKGKLYFALSKDFDLEFVKQLQNELDKLKSNDEILSIYRKYNLKRKSPLLSKLN